MLHAIHTPWPPWSLVDLGSSIRSNPRMWWSNPAINLKIRTNSVQHAGKTMNYPISPSHHHFYTWYRYHSQSWVYECLWHCLNHEWNPHVSWSQRPAPRDFFSTLPSFTAILASMSINAGTSSWSRDTHFWGGVVSIYGVHRVPCIYFVEIDLDADVDVDVVNRNIVACSSNDDNCSMEKVANKLK